MSVAVLDFHSCILTSPKSECSPSPKALAFGATPWDSCVIEDCGCSSGAEFHLSAYTQPSWQSDGRAVHLTVVKDSSMGGSVANASELLLKSFCVSCSSRCFTSLRMLLCHSFPMKSRKARHSELRRSAFEGGCAPFSGFHVLDSRFQDVFNNTNGLIWLLCCFPFGWLSSPW